MNLVSDDTKTVIFSQTLVFKNLSMLSVRISSFNKIQLVVYYQYCILIG